MKDLKELAGKYNPVDQQAQNKPLVIDEFSKGIINKVFEQLAIIFPAWKYNWKTDKELNDAKMEWTKAFSENGINTVEQIKDGFSNARKHDSDFLPSCGKFILWCKPSFEDMGWPSVQDALKQCIKHRGNQKMFRPQNIYVRPMIIELCKIVDWWQMNNASNAQERKLADKHFTEKYMKLLNSGYQEPIESEVERLPTEETVKEGMSEQQKLDQKKRSQA